MQLFGVTLSSETPSEILKNVSTYLDSDSLHHIVTVNPEYVVAAQSNLAFKKILNEASIQTVDGIGVILALEYIKQRGSTRDSVFTGFLRFFWVYIQFVLLRKRTMVTRMSGVDFIWLLVQQDFMSGRKVYLLGGREQVSAQAAKRLGQFNDKIQFRSSNGLSNVRNPDLREEADILEDIRQFKPDVLFVAYGHPWQDQWIHKHTAELSCRVAIGVGGSFDFIANRVPRAPVWLRNVGLEWLYRLIIEPKRFSRIVKATYHFMLLVITHA